MSTPASCVESYMYVPASEQGRLSSSAEFVAADTVSRIIDLEDSIRDPASPDRTADLKRNARRVLINHLVRGGDDQPFYLRVNDIRSEFFDDDVGTIASLSRGMDMTRLKGIVLPKTTSGADIDHVVSELKASVPDLSLMPLIENLEGMDNLPDIVAADMVASVGFGHHDYFFDLGVFPIPRSALTSRTYRETLDHILDVVRESNQRLNRKVGFKEGIYPNLYSEAGMQDAGRYLYRAGFGVKLGKTALNPFQARAIASIKDWECTPAVTSEDDNPGDIEAVAKEIIEVHEARRNKSLGVGRRVDGEYVSLQQVMGARLVVDQCRIG